MFQHMLHVLKERRKTESFCVEKIAVTRHQTSMFMTKAGYLGISFQHEPGFRKGDKLVLLDGFLGPMILREEGISGRFKMMGVVSVASLDEVNIKILLDKGVLRERRFEII